MKKLVLSAAMAVCLLSFVHAQDIKYGVKGGLNFAGAITDYPTIGGTKTSIHLGVVAEIVLTDKFSVQPELLYSGQGFKEETISGDNTTKLGYINIPIMAKYYIVDNLSLEVGPQFGFLASAKNDEVDDIKDTFKGFDFGLNIGAGYKLSSGLNFALRYNLGLSQISEDLSVNPFLADLIEIFDIKNSVFQLSVGYMF